MITREVESNLERIEKLVKASLYLLQNCNHRDGDNIVINWMVDVELLTEEIREMIK